MKTISLTISINQGRSNAVFGVCVKELVYSKADWGEFRRLFYVKIDVCIPVFVYLYSDWRCSLSRCV